MTLNEFLSRLKGVKPYNGYYMAMCPVHNTKDSSMSVKQGDDGKIVLHCHGGCKPEDIVDAMGLKMSDLFPDQHSITAASRDFKKIEQPPKKQPKPWKPRNDIVASYEYRDDGEHLLAVKDRYYKDGEKQQYWRYQDKTGKWFYGIGDAIIPLYKHECIDNPVYLVEGEKDVDTMIAGGLHAVTNPNGAGEWKDRYTEQLRGYHVCIIPDNDDTGRKHAETAANALCGVAASVKLADLSELWPEIPKKGDVTDYVELCRSIGRSEANIFKSIEVMRENTPEFVPSEDKQTSVDMFKSISDFNEMEATWLVKGWIPDEQITLLAADGGVGKTTLSCNIIAAISSGGQCILDPEDTQREPKKVLILTTEDSISKKLRKKLRLAGANLENIIAPDPAADTEHKMQELKFGSPYLEQVIKHFKPALCVFDPIQGYVPPEINMGARNAMRDCLAPLVTLGEETGCAFLIICHSNKRRGASGRERVSDSSDIWDIARSVMMAGFASETEKDIRYLSNEKNNYDKLQETVLFTIDDHGQIVHKGFSQKRDRDFRAEAYHVDKQEEPLNERLLEALKDAASPFDTVRFHYSDFEEKYGATIFGGKRPADALNLMKPLMEKEGYSLVVKKIKIDRQTRQGFSITPIGEMEQLPVCV